jgi:small-conductance mechanosensitive channel
MVILEIKRTDYKNRFFCTTRWLLLCVCILMLRRSAAAQITATNGTVKATVQSSTDATSLQSANGATPGQPTAPTPETAKKLFSLPTPFPPGLIQGIDAKAQSREILAHLGEVVRYYRMAVAPIQKVGAPSDALYVQQAQTEATQIGQLAFRAARSQAEFLSRIPSATPTADQPPVKELNRVTETLRSLAKKIADLQAQDLALDQQIKNAHSGERPALQDQKSDVEGQLKLSNAVAVALQKIVTSSVGETGGLQGNIDRLQHSVPELIDSQNKAVAPTLDSMGSIREAGVSTQAVVLFQLLSTERAINERVVVLKQLQDEAEALRAPLVKVLSATFAASQSIQSDTGTSSAELKAKGRKYDDLTDAFTTLSDVAIPLSQEVLLLEQAQSTLGSWRTSVSEARGTILHFLLLRVVAIALVLGIILTLSAVWKRAATRYVHDVQRRRQILLIRRLVIGFLSGLVLIFGFVTQFNSLATFAGFITAGIAVGLQTILLSVAAYFFIVGRYGVKVGDRITVAGVTGDVVEVGLVRFYLLELIGSGTELHSTGRIAVFANSILFQAGTPLYKQIPGTGYAWHELTVKFKAGMDYQPALEVVRDIVESVYKTYQGELEKQHREVEGWLDTAIRGPAVESRLQLVDGPQFAVLYPVQITDAAETDEKIVTAILAALCGETHLSKVIEGTPSVRAVVKN